VDAKGSHDAQVPRLRDALVAAAVMRTVRERPPQSWSDSALALATGLPRELVAAASVRLVATGALVETATRFGTQRVQTADHEWERRMYDFLTRRAV
jgi:hypothetical protein